jgi:transcriptional regulator with XRE-family HTH domain
LINYPNIITLYAHTGDYDPPDSPGRHRTLKGVKSMTPDRKSDPISLARQVDLLFEHGREQGKDVTYQAIGDATGESWTNILKIRKGDNTNPGLRVVQAIASYFEVGLDYFDCKTEEECRVYLAGLSGEGLLDDIVKMRSHNISPKALLTLEAMIKYVQEVEGMLPPETGAEEQTD